MGHVLVVLVRRVQVFCQVCTFKMGVVSRVLLWGGGQVPELLGTGQETKTSPS